jgi:hypothetical protein
LYRYSRRRRALRRIAIRDDWRRLQGREQLRGCSADGGRALETPEAHGRSRNKGKCDFPENAPSGRSMRAAQGTCTRRASTGEPAREETVSLPSARPLLVRARAGRGASRRKNTSRKNTLAPRVGETNVDVRARLCTAAPLQGVRKGLCSLEKGWLGGCRPMRAEYRDECRESEGHHMRAKSGRRPPKTHEPLSLYPRAPARPRALQRLTHAFEIVACFIPAPSGRAPLALRSPPRLSPPGRGRHGVRPL